jgi:hypothetical protein
LPPELNPVRPVPRGRTSAAVVWRCYFHAAFKLHCGSYGAKWLRIMQGCVIQHGANTTAPNGGEVMGGMPACPAPSTPTRSRSPRNCRPRSAGASTTHLIDAGALRGGPRRRRLWHGRRVSSGVERARACLGGRHPPSSEVYPREVELAFPSPGAAARANGMCPMSSTRLARNPPLPA